MKLGKILVTKVAFPDPKNAILSLFLLYFFRVLERRTGSLKYSSNLALGWTIGVSLELLLCPFAGVPLPPGPLALLIPLFVPFFLHIPLISSASFGPVPISSKTMIYLLGLQLCLTSTSALLGTVTSLLAGLAVFCSPLSSVMFPSWLGSLASILISPLASAPPDPGPGLLGATIEIQRTQQAEAMEQQLLRARTRFHVVSVLDVWKTSTIIDHNPLAPWRWRQTDEAGRALGRAGTGCATPRRRRRRRWR